MLLGALRAIWQVAGWGAWGESTLLITEHQTFNGQVFMLHVVTPGHQGMMVPPPHGPQGPRKYKVPALALTPQGGPEGSVPVQHGLAQLSLGLDGPGTKGPWQPPWFPEGG